MDILIAYYGAFHYVHLLNLVSPRYVLVYYYKSENVSWKGGLGALLISFALIFILMYGIIPGSTVGGWFELFFVNCGFTL